MDADALERNLSADERRGAAKSATVALGTAITFVLLASFIGLAFDSAGSVRIDTSRWTLRGTLPSSPSEPAALGLPSRGAASLRGGGKPV